MALPYTRGEVKDRAKSEWIGACNVTLPSFTEDFSALNEAGIRHDIVHAAELGFWGTLVASESGTTLDEYKRFLEVAVESAPDGFKIVSHLSFDTVDQAVTVAQLSENLGVEAGLMSYPQSFRPKSVREIVEHTRYVTDSSDLAMILFAATTWGFKSLAPTGFPLEALEEMCKTDTAAALKYEGGGAAQFSALTEVFDKVGDKVIVEYPQEQLIPAQARLLGTRWWGTSAYESYGERVPQVISALLEGRTDDAYELFWSYNAAREAKGAFHASFAGANLIHRQGWKYLGWLNGFNGGQLRMPQMRLAPGQMKSLRAGLAGSGFDLPTDDAEFYAGRGSMTFHLDSATIRQLCTEPVALDAARLALAGQRDGHYELPSRQDVNVATGFFRTMPAALGDHMGAKLMTLAKGVGNRYLLLIYRQDSGELLATLDASEVTKLRTAATTVLAGELLCPEGTTTLGIIGSGFEAEGHLRAFASHWALEKVRVFSRSVQRREGFASRLGSELGIEIEAADTAAEVAASSPVTVLCTKSTEPVVSGSDFIPGAVVLSIGSTRPDLRELDDLTFARARSVLVDDPRQVLAESGDVASAIASQAISEGSMVSMADWSGPGIQESNEGDLLLFKSVGTALQDLALGAVLIDIARKQGLGRDLGEITELKSAHSGKGS